jgi:hypothetical protein
VHGVARPEVVVADRLGAAGERRARERVVESADQRDRGQQLLVAP